MGVAESARVFIVPTILSILAIAIVIVTDLVRAHPVIAPSGHLPSVAESVGIVLLLKAFASGCSALTGVQAIANAVPEFKRPRARRAQHTEMMLGIILGLMLIGIAIGIRKFHVAPSATQTTLAQLAAAGVGRGFLFYAIQLITTVLLALAANTSFGGLPVLASLLARDNYLPHMFALRAGRQVYRNGISVLAVAAAALLVAAKGNTQALIPLFAIGVFVGFTLSQVGMVRHWREERGDGWVTRAFINGLGAVLTTIALAIELVSKFTEGAWLVVIVIPLLVLLLTRIQGAYRGIGVTLHTRHRSLGPPVWSSAVSGSGWPTWPRTRNRTWEDRCTNFVLPGRRGPLAIRDEKIGDFLDQLAERVPAPGGGAAAALQAAQGAALLGMVARYTTGEKYAEHQVTIGRIITEVDELREIALRLAEADADAFLAVTDAYRLPRGTEQERADRAGAISQALANAAWPPAQVISVAGMVVDLAEALVVIGNRNVLSDVAAAAESARSAAATARVNVEINLAGITDEQASLEMIAETGKADGIIARAEQITASVRDQIRG